MNSTATKYCLLLPLALLLSCRSEKAAFQFTPATIVAVAAPEEATATADSGLATPMLPATPARTSLVPQSAPVAAPTSQAASRRVRHARPLLQQKTQASPRRAARPLEKGEPENKVWHLVLGGALVVGGVVAGLLLGGWLGLGVGAVGVLLGYYFVVLGIGGPHAWLGVFQECFNM
ncbi:hypothetical protein PK28_00680 [Hymenobacter sp. DG25B]|uniref:hypothetical protein n=1 Tax=Hymenobacter sp. DG25B TaxID=1385664 RepID=UPI00054112AC|nr:hypothetical protein [Hymenobacter sp. DG25B]AIZ62570.1 hypothetical protein PK28_00680 [Hymenobacter sp. DG25B]